MFKSFVFLLGLLTVACATTHPGVMTESPQKAVVVSVLKNRDLSDKYYSFYEFTLENTTPEWKDVQVKDVQFDGKPTEILTDDKLSSWIEGAELKLKASNYNRDLLLGSIVVVGGVAAATSNNSNVQVAGVGAMAGGVAAAGAIDISRSRQQAVTGAKGLNQTVNVPQSHVYVPTKIAPESYIKRWVVVRAPIPSEGAVTTNWDFTAHKLGTIILIDGKTDATFTAKIQNSPYQ